MATSNKPKLAPRNPVARSPLLRKGGMHQSEKTNSRLTSAQLKHQIDDWREELEFERSLKDEQPLDQLHLISTRNISKGLTFSRTKLRFG